jgi:hypothetical protein
MKFRLGVNGSALLERADTAKERRSKMTLKPFYDRTEDVHVGAYVAYGHTDGKLYADAEHKMKVSAADLGRAFMLGRLIVCDGKNYYAPIAYAEATGVKTYDGTAAKSWTASAE